eukprot:gene32714-biopygen11612
MQLSTMSLSFQPICATTAPDWTYTYPAEWTDVNEGCGTGIARQRIAAEACPARGGCDCQNKRATLPIETEMQKACGEGTPADVTMKGQPSDCFGGELNGVYAYEGDTADGKRYYSHKTGSVYQSGGAPPVVYLFFDRDDDNGKNPGVCGAGAEGNNEWHIDKQQPDTTAAQDLDGDSSCGSFAYSRQPDTSGSLTPPASAEWNRLMVQQRAYAFV